MTKRKTRRSGISGFFDRIRSCIGTIVGGLVLIVLLIVSQATGIDLVKIFTGTPMAPVTNTQVTATPFGSGPGTLIPNSTAAPVTGVTTLNVPTGFGAQKGIWQVYFTAPTGSSDATTYRQGIDTALVAAIDRVTSTLEIAAYEFNDPLLTEAVIRAAQRDVRVRIVTDTQDGLEDEETTLRRLRNAGASIVDDQRTALMHNKFMILDRQTVWTGSWNYTINDTYRNNNNAIAIRSQRLVTNYLSEFEEMFVNRQFGPSSPSTTPFDRFTVEGVTMEVHFAPEDEVVNSLIASVNSARTSIRFMAFSFTVADLGNAISQRSRAGVDVRGIYERTGSETQFSTLRTLFCAGLPVRQDGNSYILHHKVFIIDNETVVTGSFNFSANAMNSNDENLLIIRDPALAAQYTAEFDRRWAEARQPALSCF